MAGRENSIVNRTIQAISSFRNHENQSSYTANTPRLTPAEAATERAKDYDLAQVAGAGATLMTADDNFDRLVAEKKITIYDKMMTDSVVINAINQKRFDVISADWSVDAASSEERDAEIAEFVQWNFERMEGSIVAVTFGIMNALVHGYSVGEMNFAVCESGDYAGKWFIKNIKNKNVEDFKFKFDEYGNMTELWCRDPMGPDYQVPVGKFALYTYQPEYSRVYGKSDLRAAYKHWWSKDKLIKFQNMYLEKYGIPPLTAKTPPTWTATQRKALRDMLKRMLGGSVLVYPNDVDLITMEINKAGAGEFEGAINYHDDKITQAIIGQVLTSGVGDSGHSLALGNVHKETKEDYVSFLRADLAEFIRERIIKTIVDLNYADVTDYPYFKWQPRKGKLAISNVAEIDTLLKSGILSNRDVNAIRERIDLPWDERFDNEEPYEPPTWAKPPTGGAMFAVKQIEQPSKSEHAKQPTTRTMTPTEKRLGGMSYYEKQNKIMDAAEDKLLSELIPVIKKIQGNVTKYVQDKVIGGDPNKNKQAINDLKVPAGLLRELNDAAKPYIRDLTYDAYFDAMGEVSSGVDQKGLPKRNEFGKYDITLEAAPDAGAIVEIDKWKESGDWAKIRAYRARKLADLGGTHETMAQFWITDVIEEGILRDVKNDIIAGLLTTGTGEAGIMSQVRATFEKWGADPKLVDPARLKVIVRTNTTRAIADSRRLAFSDPEVMEEFPAQMFAAIMDDRTSDICASLDGNVYRVDDPVWNSITPPMHYNCRSTLIAVSAQEYKDTPKADLKAPDLSEVPVEFGGLKAA